MLIITSTGILGIMGNVLRIDRGTPPRGVRFFVGGA